MTVRSRIGSPGRLAAVFVALTAVPLVVLGWLGWRLLENESLLDVRQRDERLDSAGQLVASDMDRSLAAWESAAARALSGTPVDAPSGTVLLVIEGATVVRTDGVSIPFLPTLGAGPSAQPAALAAAMAAETRARDLRRAEALYRAAASATGTVRGQALIGLVRCLEGQENVRGALDALDDLAALGPTPVFGFPAALLAYEQRARLFDAAGDEQARDTERARLRAAVLDGQYAPDRAAFDHFVDELGLAPPETPSLALADAIADQWSTWWRSPQGRTGLSRDGHALAAAWQAQDGRLAIVAGPADALAAGLEPTLHALGVVLTIQDADGTPVWGAAPRAGDAPTRERSLSPTGLPWELRVSPVESGVPGGWLSRPRFFAAGFMLLALVIGGASYAVYRSVNRELGVARLQSEFVSAVSHEFRTPLTAIAHLSEVLEDNAASAAEKPRYYRAIGREAARLTKLVEGLLDLGRLESGRRHYDMRLLDAGAFAIGVVDDFRSSGEADGRLVDVRQSSAPLAIVADPGALGIALRNLLENAVKYSAAGAGVTVSVAPVGDEVGISVADRGVGIPEAERRDVFRKFVRGSAARDLNIKGTGVGLAITTRIVEAHGGRVEVTSEAGRGSRFTIVLPQPEPDRTPRSRQVGS